MTTQLGDLRLTTISGGPFRLDGGAMFGVVPRPLWSRLIAPDDQNRIPLATNCVLIEAGTKKILIETGCGSKLPEKQRQIFATALGDPLVENLRQHGVEVGDIDSVILSHLHFDHAGGGTQQLPDGSLRPTFPNAEYFVQRWEWQIATGNFPELRGSYPPENLLPLQASGQLRLVDGDVEIVPGVWAEVTGGHTQGHQALLIESRGETAAFVGDLCPTTRHLPQLWGMGYDVDLLQLRRRKRDLLGRIADRGWLALWDHDPDLAAARLERDPRRDFAVAEGIATL
jgi:glyoxylase-like metal-dependent hydrolase (beta-lactamase superfamily II)